MKEYTPLKLAKAIEFQLNEGGTDNLNSCCMDGQWKVSYNSWGRRFKMTYQSKPISFWDKLLDWVLSDIDMQDLWVGTWEDRIGDVKENNGKIFKFIKSIKSIKSINSCFSEMLVTKMENWIKRLDDFANNNFHY